MQTQLQPLDFEAFLAWYPDTNQRYELIEGIIHPVLPTGPHETLGGFLIAELNFHIRQQQLPYVIPRACLLKPATPNSGYQPDIAVCDSTLLATEPLWPNASVIQNGATVPLAIEVVSTNWRDDYGHKFVEYEAMGIGEYWIVDYRALGAIRHTGKPKQPTVTLCHLVAGEYQVERYIAGQQLASRLFPSLCLSTDAVFAAAGLTA